AANLVEHYQAELLSPAPPPPVFQLTPRAIASNHGEPIACYASFLKPGGLSATLARDLAGALTSPPPVNLEVNPPVIFEASFAEAATPLLPWLIQRIGELADAMILSLGQLTSL